MISIVMPVLNEHEMTDECIQAMQKNTSDYELIIIDNGSDPSISEALHIIPDIDFKLIRNEENLGFPVAVNQGIRASSGDIIILLNNDVFCTPQWAERLCAALDDYDIIGPCTNYCAGYQRVRLDEIYYNIDELDIEATKWSAMHDGRVDDVNWVIGFCMAFKRSLYDELGEFDESLWPSSGEEIDFCLKAKQAGKKVGIAIDVYVHHEGSVTFKDMNAEHPYRDIIEKSEKHIKDKWGSAYESQGVDA